MTVQSEDTENRSPHLLRKTTDGITSYATQSFTQGYGLVKNWSPARIQTYLNTVEGVLPVYYQPLVSKLGSASDPLIESLDTRLEGVIQKVNDQVISPIKQLHEKLDLDKDGRVGYSDIRNQLGEIKSQLSTKADEIKVKVTSTAEGVKGQAEEKVGQWKQKVGQWKSLRGDLSKKAVDRLEKSFERVRQFSAVQAKSYIHVDLIEYAREVLDNAQTTTQPAFEAMHQQLVATTNKVTETVAAVQEAARNPDVRAELQEKLKVAMSAARQLSRHSVAFVLRRYQVVQSQVNLENLQNLPATSYRYSREVILNSPAVLNSLVNDLKTKGVSATLEVTAKATVEHANQLLAAVKDVVAQAQSESAASEKADVPESDVQESAANGESTDE